MTEEEESAVVKNAPVTTDGISSLAQSAALMGIEYRPQLEDPDPPEDLGFGEFDKIAGSWGRQYSLVPIGGNAKEVIVATSSLLDPTAFEQLEYCARRPVTIVAAPEEEITRAINSLRTRLMKDRSSALSNDGEDQDGEGEGQLKIDVTDAEDEDAPIMRYVNAIIFKASSERASDVHVEPFEAHLKVRFRIDGVLYDVDTQDKMHQAAITSRIKVMAGLNIAEKRLPQDGRIGLRIAGKDVDIRVSTVPTQFGERVVLRLLDKSATILDIDQIGIREKNLKILRSVIHKPNGIILLTGPTGSGKTTTLYSCLTEINTPELNILTVEDPIEYQLDGIGQMQVNPKIQFTFASGLRAILRQDPDVVMVGEIRDIETAEIAIQASLTGHLVFSTLHTNDAPGAVTRLVDMGIEPFLVSSSLLAVIGQRLVRRLCPDCKEPHELSGAELIELGLDPESVPTRTGYRPGKQDCLTCQNTRYLGRTGIHEVLSIDDYIRSLILQRLDSTSIRTAAISRGFESLRADGGHKVLEGITSMEEVILATHEDLSPDENSELRMSS